MLWAAGVAASPLARSLGVPLDRAGRVLVEPDLTVPGHPEVFVIGDLAPLKQRRRAGAGRGARRRSRAGATPPQTSARTLARRAARPVPLQGPRLAGDHRPRRGGRRLRRIKLSGFIAWLAWLLIHILVLIGFKNRFTVLLQWAWSYVTYERGARLITGGPRATSAAANAAEAAPPSSPLAAVRCGSP